MSHIDRLMNAVIFGPDERNWPPIQHSIVDDAHFIYEPDEDDLIADGKEPLTNAA